jgi:hypothetical protein
MITRLIVATCCSLFFVTTHAQKQLTSEDSVANYFNEIKIAAKKQTRLWNRDLYGPILLVNRVTMEVYANVPDSAGILKPKGAVFAGNFPREINIANTSVHWSGKHWAMVILPLSEKKEDRINLLAHELFHKAQSSLGFKLPDPNNNHLDEKDGRIYLRLELEALKKALTCTTNAEMKQHITNALAFRKYRYSMYPAADSTENMLELNEGLAEYTGVIIRGGNKTAMTAHFNESINSFLSNSTFVRSFAYQTIPVYGYLLHTKKSSWNKDITVKSQLTDYFIKAFGISLPGDLSKWVNARLNEYSGTAIIEEETKREERRKQLIAEYKSKFIEQPHFDIRFEKMRISFDPRNIMPLEDKGTVYPNIRVTDTWGILEVSDGALMSPQWDRITVTNPVTIEGKNVKGNGWALTLDEGYTVEKDANDGKYKLLKK